MRQRHCVDRGPRLVDHAERLSPQEGWRRSRPLPVRHLTLIAALLAAPFSDSLGRDATTSAQGEVEQGEVERAVERPGADTDPAKDARKGKGGAKGKGEPKRKGAAKGWLRLADGLQQLRKNYAIAVIVYSAAERDPLVDAPGLDAGGEREVNDANGRAPAKADQSLEELFSHSTVTRALKKYVRIRLRPADLELPYPMPAVSKKSQPAVGKSPEGESPSDGSAREDASNPDEPPPSVREVLDLRAHESTVLILDLRERIVRRWTAGDPLPTRNKMKTTLGRYWKVNDVFRRRARQVEPQLEKARYSLRAGDSRGAILLVREYEEPKAQQHMDPVLRERCKEMFTALRDKAKEAIRAADALDEAKEYLKAIEAYDVVAKDFPFRDIAIHAAKRKGELLRKLQFGK